MASHRLQHLVKGGPSFSTVITDGAVASTVAGEELDGADLVVHLSAADAAALGTGELTLDEGFMMGRVKIEGSMGLVMDLVPVLRGADYGAAVAAAAAS
jgi:putative sterol carrier protein